MPVLRVLLDAGADINARTIHDNAPLHLAAMYGRTEQMEELFQRGADKELLRLDRDLYFDGRYAKFPFPVHTICDSGAFGAYDGTTPVSTAVNFAQPASVRIPLRHGVDVTKKSKKGLTILHMAAQKGNIATIAALAEGRFKGLDAQDKDSAGMTAEDYLDQRVDYTPSLSGAFRKHLASVQHYELEGTDPFLRA